MDCIIEVRSEDTTREHNVATSTATGKIAPKTRNSSDLVNRQRSKSVKEFVPRVRETGFHRPLVELGIVLVPNPGRAQHAGDACDGVPHEADVERVPEVPVIEGLGE
jgi:hypothetical protein